jgi:hypothetical protein
MVERVVTNRLVDALNLSGVDHDWPDEEDED